jgi:hypothetical protein
MTDQKEVLLPKIKNTIVLGEVIIESRESDNFINATQLCKAGKKFFKDWYRLESTQELIKELENNLLSDRRIITSQNISVVDIKKGNSKNYTQGSWIHPDLAVQLAQWISPSFAIQVSRWIRELFITGSVSVDSKKTDNELFRLQKQIQEKDKLLEERNKVLEEQKLQLEQKDNLNFKLRNFVENVKMREKKQIIYIATTELYATQDIFKVGGCSGEVQLKNRLNQYNSGRIEGDHYYYCFIIYCNNSTHMETRIKEILKDFRNNKDKENYVMNFNILKEILQFLVDNYNNEIDKLNEFMRNIIQNMSNTENVIPPPIILNSVEIRRICNGQEVETKIIDLDNLPEEEQETIVKELMNMYIESRKEVNISRKQFEDFIDLEKKELRYKKRTLWKHLKNIGKTNTLQISYI